MTTFHGPPEDLGQLHNLFLEACKTAGLTVLEDGCSYSNGPEYNAEIRLPDGFVAFTTIRESQDDNYLIERYEEPEDDPDGRSPTPAISDPEAYRRELEEEAHFAELEQRNVAGDAPRAYMDDFGLDLEPDSDDDDTGHWSQAAPPDNDADVGFAPGVQ